MRALQLDQIREASGHVEALDLIGGSHDALDGGREGREGNLVEQVVGYNQDGKSHTLGEGGKGVQLVVGETHKL